MGEISRRGFLRGSLVTTAGAVLLGRGQQEAAQAAEAAEAAGRGAAETTTVKVKVNGEGHALHVGADDLALDTLREELDLTGTKRGCGHGACGACTVLVDGEPHVSCLLPSVALNQRQVTTVEAVGGGDLHPIQRAFMARDALQCGYCTPGFIVEGVAFHDRWRAEHPGEEPSREVIASAMGGHLCRCGAYQNIYSAIQDACAGRFDADTGESPRIEARAKVTGAAKYTVDIKRPGQLEAGILRSPHAHAVLKGIDASRALALDGVKAFVQFTPDGARIRYAGLELAGIAAVDAHTAREALALIDVQYEVLPSITTMDDARATGAAPIFEGPKQDKEAISAAEGPVLAADWDGNVRGPVNSNLFAKPRKVGPRMDEARREGQVIEGVFKTQVQCHTTLEPHAAVAEWTGPDRVDVWASTQSCSHLAEDIAEVYELEHENARVHCDFVGAGFGGKAGLQMEVKMAVELARAAGAPVRVELGRADELTVAAYRPGSEIHFTVGALADGSQAGMISRAYAESGIGVGNNTGFLMRIAYASKFKDLEDFDVITHTAPGKPFRGPGGPQAFFAVEQSLDQLALKRGEDPIDLRRRWDINKARLRLYDWAQALPAWKERGALDRSGRYRQGVGVAAAGWYVFHSVNAQMRLDAGPGGFVISCGCQDMGNGSKSVAANEVARILGISPLDVTVRFGDSSLPRGPISGGSRTTLTIGPIAAQLAEQMRDALVEIAEDELGYKGARAIPGGVAHASGQLSWRELLAASPPLSMVERRAKDPGGYFMPITVADLRVGKESTGAVQVTRVQVDTRLGRVEVLETWIGLGVGRLVVPDLARSQAEGGVVQGVSFALYEERRLDPRTTRNLTANMEDYRIAGMGDVPLIHVHFDEEGFEGQLGRAVGLSELSTLPAAASIANAVHDATGWRPRSLPLRPDVVLGGLV